LHFLDKQVTRALHQEGEERESRDGMDIGICAIHLQERICQFSGANIPLYLIRDGEVSEFEAIKESIGGYKERDKEFYSHEFDLKSGDVLYMTTDGFLDQFGGELGKKFMKKRFRELIAYIAPLPITEQKAALENAFEQWKGNRKQVDDILVIAIRIP
jgi:serine phosphatase RsbU (regulator of sigma subunit)